MVSCFATLNMVCKRWTRGLKSASNRHDNSPEHETLRVASKPAAASILDHGQVDPQLESPIFARLPLELREMIWDYALRKYQDTSEPFSRDVPFCRPGREGPVRIAVDLLSTCRAVYLETYTLPIRLNALTDANGDRHNTPPGYDFMGFQILSRLALWQFVNLSALDLTMLQPGLENEDLKERLDWLKMVENDLMDKADRVPDEDLLFGPSTTDAIINHTYHGAPSFITHLTIRLGRNEWRDWSADPLRPTDIGHLALDPAFPNPRLTQHRLTTVSAMVEAAEQRRQGTFEGQIETESWGYQISRLKNLKELELILETFPNKKAQIDKVVECAKSWRFDMHEGYELKFAEVESTTLEGYGRYDSERQKLWANSIGWIEQPVPEGFFTTQRGYLPSSTTRFFEVRTMKWKLARKEKPTHSSDSE